jgi:hypothetical protein
VGGFGHNLFFRYVCIDQYSEISHFPMIPPGWARENSSWSIRCFQQADHQVIAYSDCRIVLVLGTRISGRPPGGTGPKRLIRQTVQEMIPVGRQWPDRTTQRPDIGGPGFDFGVITGFGKKQDCRPTVKRAEIAMEGICIACRKAAGTR